MTTHLKLRRSLVAVALLATVAACGGGSPATNNQSANNMQQTMGNDSAQAMPSGPFSHAEMQMHERMMAATGANASETWARKMIVHHRGAIEMSQVLINGGGDPAMVRMARESSAKQQREITELERMVAGGINGGTGEANPYAPIEQRMHQAMMAASGADISETWARKMIAHHQGAIEMSEALIRQGGAPEVVAMARRAVADQTREKEHLEAMLRGEGIPTAGAPAAAAGPEAPRRNAPATSGQRNAAPAPPAERNQPSSRPTPRPTPPPPEKASCAPEHRAAGHC